MKEVKAIAASMAGLAVCIAVYFVMAEWFVDRQTKRMQTMVKDLQGRPLEAIEKINARAADEAERARQEKLKRAAELREQEAEKGRDVERVKALAARREREWKAFYKPTNACQTDPTTVDCANAYIRAKRLFDEKGSK